MLRIVILFSSLCIKLFYYRMRFHLKNGETLIVTCLLILLIDESFTGSIAFVIFFRFLLVPIGFIKSCSCT